MFKSKSINITHLVSLAADGAPSMIGAQEGFVAFTAKVFGQKTAVFSLHLISRNSVCSNVSPRMHASNECHSNYQQNNGKSFKSPSVSYAIGRRGYHVL